MFLIPTIIKQIFNPAAEPLIPTGISTKEAKAEMETHLINIIPTRHIKPHKLFYPSYSSIHFDFFRQLNKFLFLVSI